MEVAHDAHHRAPVGQRAEHRPVIGVHADDEPALPEGVDDDFGGRVRARRIDIADRGAGIGSERGPDHRGGRRLADILLNLDALQVGMDDGVDLVSEEVKAAGDRERD